MRVVIAFISQKGGVGKSTLARGVAALLARAGLAVRLADLDAPQRTALEWGKVRASKNLSPSVDVRGYASIESALDDCADVEILVLDAPGRANQSTLKIATNAHLVVQPTNGGLDDLRPGILLFHELVAAGVRRERLAFALCRTQLSEEDDARAYLERSGYTVLAGSLPERGVYRAAQNQGRAVNETTRDTFNDRADALMLEIMSRVAGEIHAQQKFEIHKKSRGGS